MKILVTGANGFVGSALLYRLADDPAFEVLGAVRQKADTRHNRLVGDLVTWRDTDGMLAGLDAIVHCAARAHVMRDTADDPLAEFRKVNVEGTLNLAQQAADAGVKRFIFLSSIKVNGETTHDTPFTSFQPPQPKDAYGVSKLEAEEGLRRLAHKTGMELVIVRPPLAYGPGVKGNWQALTNVVRSGIPLPLGAIHNRRSFVALENLVDLIVTCLRHPAARGETFLVSDDKDVSTTTLLRNMAAALQRPARLIPVPQGLLCALLSLLGRQTIVERLCGSLQADISHTKETLGWKPVITMEAQLAKMTNGTSRDAIGKS
ncbi:MAG: SDR family oxidoreductase [Burkholderiaceae bacterium]|jgi:UDP-glucose 4-epimerase|nr:SDR family oxidoreductase [Burkholderiaceae bacterium]